MIKGNFCLKGLECVRTKLPEHFSRHSTSLLTFFVFFLLILLDLKDSSLAFKVFFLYLFDTGKDYVESKSKINHADLSDCCKNEYQGQPRRNVAKREKVFYLCFIDWYLRFA